MKTKITILCLFSMLSFLSFGKEQIKEDAQKPKKEQLDPVYKDFRISLGGGYAHRLGKREKYQDSELDRILKDLMHGYNLDLEAQYFFTESYGIGINLNYVNTSAKGSNIDTPNLGTISSYKETNKFTYVGPAFAMRHDLNKFLLTGSIGLGAIFYENSTNITLKGTKTTIGMNAGVAFEYKLNKNWGAGLKLSYIIGTIKSLNSGGKSLDLNESQSVSNLMLTGFISFRTGK